MPNPDNYPHEQLFLFEEPEFQPKEHLSLSAGYSKFTAYQDFTQKFEAKKTTDDCYTPQLVIEVVERYVRTLPNVGDRPFVRPFYPGGDFESFNYPPDCVVVDNPPFSIYAKIVRWYISRGIDFFLFAPTLTLCVKGADVCFIVAGANVTYDNGAVVNTSFTTNLIKGIRFRIDGKLRKIVEDASRQSHPKAQLPIYEMPLNVVTPARLQKIANGGVVWEIPSDQCHEVSNLDAMKERKKGVFGGCYLISDAQAQAQAQARKANAITMSLSEREREIVRRLNKK